MKNICYNSKRLYIFVGGVNMSIIKQNEDLVTYVKNTILKYCPYVDDRLSIFRDTNSPEIEIDINIYNNETQVMFLFGSANYKQSIPEQIIIPCTLEFEEVSKIIDFILGDHEVIKNINLCNNSFELQFAINWTEESLKGINCSDIGLNLEFNNNVELERQYLYLFFQKYYSVLEHTPSFKQIKNEYINNVKNIYLNDLDKTQLISLLNTMDENELKQLLNKLDNDVFIKYIIGDKTQDKEKQLLLGK